MKTGEILKSITPEVKKKEIEKIQKVKLPPELQKWVREYEKVGGERDEFIWKWIYNVSKIITLSNVGERYKKSAWEMKFLLIMFVVLVDDVADKHKDEKMLVELLKIPFNKPFIKLNQFSEKKKNYVKFVTKVWLHVKNIYRKYPRYGEFEKIIEFDVKQLLNAMEYSYLVNENKYLINSEEYNIYFSHNMQLIIDIMIDMSCFSKIDLNEMGTIRKISLHAQKMTRVGNWITTWEREIDEKDFTSIVFAHVVELHNIPTVNMEKINKLELIKKIRKSGAEEKLLKEWDDHYEIIKKLGEKTRTINIDNLLSSLEKIISLHIISRGYK